MEAHNGLIPGGAKYTRGRRPVELVYSESFHNKQDAQRREYAIKQMTKTKKLRLIEGCKIVLGLWYNMMINYCHGG